MAVESAFQELKKRMGRLHEALVGLRVTVVEDRPAEGGTLLAEALGDLAEDLLGAGQEALALAREGARAAGPPLDTERTRAALTGCQERLNGLLRRFFAELARYERVAEIARLGRERGQEWKAWTSSVRQGIEACREPLWGAQEALAVTWQEMAERATAGSVSVRAVNIGGQVTVAASPEAVNVERDLMRATS